MPSHLTAVPVSPGVDLNFLISPWYTLLDRWEVCILAALMLSMTSRFQLWLLAWLLMVPVGFLLGNFHQTPFYAHLSSLFLFVSGLWALQQSDRPTRWVVPDTVHFLAAWLAGLSMGTRFYSTWPLSLTAERMAWHLLSVWLLAIVSLLPALWLQYQSGSYQSWIERRLPMFGILTGGADLIAYFWR